MGVRRALISLALSIPALGAAQAPPVTQVEIGKLGAGYGDVQVVPLDEIVRSPDRFQRQMVRTQGLFEPGLDLTQYVLSEGHDRVLLLPVVAGSEVQMLLGRRVEVRGVVRKIRPKQYVMGEDLDKIEDPELPVMPAPGLLVPRVTLSYFSISDATPLEHAQGGGGVLQGLLQDPHAEGRKARVVGQFRGANLFGDLPDLPGREPDDFVLKEGDAAIWVIGKAAKGKGFHLDPRLRADTRFWLEVEGRLEPCAGNQVCLKARHVQMAKRPAPPAED
jgi:hypothetical protein